MIDYNSFIKVNKIKKNELADFLGTSNAFITQICQGKRTLPKDKLDKIKANDKGWDLSMLIEREDNLPYKKFGLKERLVKFAREQYDMGQTKFENYTEINPGTINKIKDGVSTTTLAKIITKCPELNVRWLLLGEGDMKLNLGGYDEEKSLMVKALVQFHNQNPDTANDMMCELRLLKQEKDLRDKFDLEMTKKDETIAKLTSMLEYAQKKDATDAGCAVAKQVG